jgi:voltage-gated potassium channel
MAESPEEKLLRQAKSPADAAFLTKFNSRMALPLILAAVIPLFIIPGSPNDTVAAGIVVVLSWLVFLLDYVVHSRRVNGYLRTWVGKFDLAVVVLTAPWFLLLPGTSSRFVLAIRLARLARLVMASSGARRLFDRLGKVALVAIVVVVVGAAIGYYAEHPTNPEFKTLGDSLWWAIVTLTTVGYGDVVPNTLAGRVDAVMIMLTGIAMLGLLAGSLASFFRLAPPPGSAAAMAEEAGDPTEEVANELAALRAEVARLADAVSSLQRNPPP